MKFTYSSGQRPLDGYTLKRGIGRGGFGEVYYALSDGGKEVALKLVSGNLEVELRGVAQCLNLKHANLVDLYDLRTDGQGDHWVVMEYVAGESLNAVLSRHPDGLAPELVQQWFLALARAVAYLHDHGIVHRDLKPANIFLENGIVKVGDYGLSKFISGSQRTAQTQSVGTVHYMAPEISTGNYNKQIDIYAAGVILYEMLTGRVPFDGESAGEILMKHLTSPPDLSRVPTPYLGIVAKALAKNPAHRYLSMLDMARDLEAVGQEQPQPAAATVAAAPAWRPAKPDVLPALTPVSVRGQVGELAGSMALAVVLAGLFATLWAALGRIDDLVWVGSLFYLTVTISWTVLVPGKIWDARVGDSWTRRVVMLLLGALVGIATFWLHGGALALPVRESLPPVGGWPRELVYLFSTNEGVSVVAGYLSYFALALCVVRWWKMTDRRRNHRFSFFPILAAGFWALLLLFLWPWPTPPYGAGALVLSAAIVQLVSPWEQPPPRTLRRMRLRYA